MFELLLSLAIAGSGLIIGLLFGVGVTEQRFLINARQNFPLQIGDQQYKVTRVR